MTMKTKLCIGAVAASVNAELIEACKTKEDRLALELAILAETHGWRAPDFLMACTQSVALQVKGRWLTGRLSE